MCCLIDRKHKETYSKIRISPNRGSQMSKITKLLIQRVRNGNQNAFGQLVELHQFHVEATIRGMLGNCAEVEDVGQETFIRAYKNLNQFKGEASFQTWVTRIAINLSLNELKKRNKQRERFQLTEDTSKYERNLEGNRSNDSMETRDLVQQGINQLDDKFRSVLVLRLIQGYSTKETAEILEIPQGTVLSRLNTAQKRLKEALVKLHPELNK